MIKRIRKYVTPEVKELLLDSLLYRIYNRVKLNKNEIRFSCELTTKCNLRCNMCTRSIFVQEGQFNINEMDKEITDRVISEIKKFHKYGKPVTFAPMGLGEPILYKDLFNLFGKIKSISKSIRIVLVTNGILLDNACAKELILLEVDEVSISLNSVNKTSYKEHMGVDCYDKIYSNIKQLIKLRNESDKILPSIFVQYLDYDNNKDIFQVEIKKWLDIMKYGDKCYIHPIVNEASFFSAGNNFKALEKPYPCAAPLVIFGIKMNGDIYPCDPAFYAGTKQIESLYLGNLIDQSPYELFLDKNSKRYNIVKDMMKADYTRLPECEKCNVYKLGSNCFFELPRFLRFNGRKWL